ncbi:MAG TPA: copper chaperone PCu(A)C [Gammaproteobacteria bacterium]|jgi:copper(I)-binding protein|nr:copper chaperone PCu(A)C [Gammaproteobacteria bacterium]
MTRIALATFLAALSCVATAADAPKVVDPWIRATPPQVMTGAAYLTIQGGDAADTLTGVRSGVAAKVEIHTTMQHDGVMHMMPVESLPIPAHGTVKLAPGGEHLMLTGLTRALTPGQSVTITLQFEHAGAMDVTFPVVDARSEDAAGHHGDHAGHH